MGRWRDLVIVRSLTNRPACSDRGVWSPLLLLQGPGPGPRRAEPRRAEPCEGRRSPAPRVQLRAAPSRWNLLTDAAAGAPGRAVRPRRGCAPAAVRGRPGRSQPAARGPGGARSGAPQSIPVQAGDGPGAGSAFEERRKLPDRSSQVSLSLRGGPGPVPPKPPCCLGENGNSSARHPSRSRGWDKKRGETSPVSSIR